MLDIATVAKDIIVHRESIVTNLKESLSAK